MKTAVLRPEVLSDDALLARVDELVGRSRRVEAELVWHLAEVDARKLYLREACPSMHAYATSRLHLSDAEAYLRITVARVSRRFPVVLRMLADGRLHLSAIAKLAPHLREENGEALLARAVHRSKRELELLLAELAPKADVPSFIRRVRPAAGGGPLRPDGVAPDAELRPDGVAPDVADHCGAAVAAGTRSSAAARMSASTAASHNGIVAPLSVAAGSAEPSQMTARYKVQFTADAELRDKIARAQGLLRHQIPDGDLGAVVDRAMTLLVRELERARFGATGSPRKSVSEVDPTPSSRHIPAPIRRAVWERDGGQCTFRDGQGRRCSARDRLEFHHEVAFARGGDHSAGNVSLRCAAHNAYQAEIDFGAPFMAERRRVPRSRSTSTSRSCARIGSALARVES